MKYQPAITSVKLQAIFLLEFLFCRVTIFAQIDINFLIDNSSIFRNVMTSQEVIDFVRVRIEKQTKDDKSCKLSEICEEVRHLNKSLFNKPSTAL